MGAVRPCGLCAGEQDVVVELRRAPYKTDEQIPKEKKKKAWHYKFWQGDHAMERFICTHCIDREWESELRFINDYQRLARAAERADLGLSYNETLYAGDLE